MTLRTLTRHIGRPAAVAVIAMALALLAATFGGNWVARADEHTGSTLPGTLPPAPEPGAPATPEFAVAVAGDGEAGVAWAAPRTGAPGDVTSYTVTSSPGSGSFTVDADVRHVLAGGLDNGVEYVFSVVANGPAGSSAATASNAVVPEEGKTIPEGLLVKLERHLQDQLNKAHARFEDARGKAMAGFEKQSAKARSNFEKHSGNARARFERVQGQARAKLERARGTARFDRVHEQVAGRLDEAEERLAGQIARLEERLVDRLDGLSEGLRERLENLHERLSERLAEVRENIVDRVSGDDEPDDDHGDDDDAHEGEQESA